MGRDFWPSLHFIAAEWRVLRVRAKMTSSITSHKLVISFQFMNILQLPIFPLHLYFPPFPPPSPCLPALTYSPSFLPDLPSLPPTYRSPLFFYSHLPQFVLLSSVYVRPVSPYCRLPGPVCPQRAELANVGY